MSTEAALKPCPFCGSQPKQSSCMAPELVRCVNDEKPHCPASFGGVSVETWNRRAPGTECELTDAQRLFWFCNDIGVDEIGTIDVHEQASIYASAFGTGSPKPEDYLAAYRDAIDSAMSQGKEKP